MNEDRRTIIRLISVLYIILAAVKIIMGAVILFSGDQILEVLQGMGNDDLSTLKVVFLIGAIIGIIGLIGAIGVMKFKKWGLYLTIIASIFFVVDGIYSISIQTSGLFSFVVPAIYSVILIYNRKEFTTEKASE